MTTFSSPDSQTFSIYLPGSTVPDVTYHRDNPNDMRGLTVTRPSGNWHYSFQFNFDNNLGKDYSTTTAVQDPTGLVTTITNTGRYINHAGFQWARPKIIVQGGRTWSYQSDIYGRTWQVTRPEGDYDTYTYDSSGNILNEVRTPKPSSMGLAATTMSATYYSDGIPARTNKMLSFTDARNNTTNYQYDANGFLLQKVFPPSTTGSTARQDSYTYNLFSVPGGGTTEELTSKTEALGAASAVTTSYSYSGSTNVQPTSITRAVGAVNATTQYTYTPLGDVDIITDPVGNPTRNYYDQLRRLVAVVGPDPDGAGPLLFPVTETTYNPHGLVMKVVQGTVTNQSDAASSSLVAIETRNTGYDPADRMNHADVMANSATVSATDYAYDAGNRLTTTTVRLLGQGADRVMLNAYDTSTPSSTGLLLSTTTAFNAADGSSSTVSYTYTGDERRKSLTDGGGHVTNYAYDGLDRLQTTTYDDGSTEVLGYDANGNLLSDKRRDNQTIGYQYDAVNNRTDRTGPLVNHYVYDTLGRLTSATGGSFNVARTYDALGNMLTDAIGGNTVTSHYDAAGRRTYITLSGAGGNAIFQYDYLANGALGRILDSYGTPHATFGYDDLGRLTSIVRTASNHGTTLAYGTDLRLASIAHTLGGGAGNGVSNDVSFGFQYNPAGQITSRTVSNEAYVYAPPTVDQAYTPNGLNQLTSGSAVTHDGQGNNTGSTISPGTTRAFDALGKLTSGFQGGGATTTLLYDALDRLASVQAAGATAATRIAWDGDERVGSWVGASGVNPVMIINGPDGSPVVGADFSPGSFTTSTEFFTDERGSLIAEGTRYPVTAITQHYTYGPYGRENSTSHPSLLGYAGGIALPGAGLVHMRARAYDPALGRFASPDPIGVEGGINLYGYAGGDPIDRTDPTGTEDKRNYIVNDAPFSPYQQDAQSGGHPTGPCDCVERLIKLGIHLLGDALGLNNDEATPQGKAQPGENADKQKPADKSRPGSGRNGALREARRQNGVPTSGGTPEGGNEGPNRNRLGEVVAGREYTYRDGQGREVRIRDDAAGHNYGEGDPQNRGPHFNDPAGNHYDYPPR